MHAQGAWETYGFPAFPYLATWSRRNRSLKFFCTVITAGVAIPGVQMRLLIQEQDFAFVNDESERAIY